MRVLVTLPLLYTYEYSGREKTVSSVRNDDLTKRHYTLRLRKSSDFIFVEVTVTTGK